MSSHDLISNGVAVGHFSSLLKHWRNVRRLTQIELAGDANISARHLCFLETGRARPSREMVHLLGGRSICRSRSAMRCTLRPASWRPMAIEDWRPIICSTCARHSISFFDNRSLIPELSSMAVGTSYPQPGVRASVQAFSRVI